MKKNEQIIKLLNEHYFLNFQLGLCYLNLSNKLNNIGMFNFSKYMRKLSDDKLTAHKDRIYTYINANKINIIGEISNLKTCDYNEPAKIAKFVLNQEEKVRSLVNEFSKVANNLEDYETFHFLTWFVNDGVKDFIEIEYINQLFELSSDNLTIDQAIKEINCK